METTNNTERRTLTQQELSVIRVASLLRLTHEYSLYLSREQMEERIQEAYEDLMQYSIKPDNFLERNFDRFIRIRYRQIWDFYQTHKRPRFKRRE